MMTAVQKVTKIEGEKKVQMEGEKTQMIDS